MYDIIYSIKKEDKDFPRTFKELTIKIIRLERKQKLEKLKKQLKINEDNKKISKSKGFKVTG